MTWGDGASTDMSVSGGADGAFLVTFDHDYKALGSFDIGWSAYVTSGSGCINNSGTLQFTLTVPCPNEGVDTNITLPAVSVPAKFSYKRVSISYSDLPLYFGVIDQNPLCTVQSNEGRLRVYLNTGLGSVHIADSVTTATVDFIPASDLPANLPVCNFKGLQGIKSPNSNPTLADYTEASNCLANTSRASTDLYAEWYSPGFTEESGPFSVPVTSELIYYVDVDTFAGSPPVNFRDTLQKIETYLHTTLIANLPTVTKVALVQDPPAQLEITDPLGRTVGVGADNKIQTFPGAGYAQVGDRSIAWFLAPVPGTYSVTAKGKGGSSFHTIFSELQFLGHGRKPLMSNVQWKGKIGRHGKSARRFAVHGDPTGAVLLPRESTRHAVVGGKVRFTLQGSVIPFGPVTIVWWFGDRRDATGLTVAHRYSRKGSYAPTVTITNALGTKITLKLPRIKVVK